MLAFLLSPVGRWIAGVAAVLGLLAAIWFAGDRHGHKIERVRQARALAAAEAKVKATEAHQAQTAQVILQAVEKTRTVIQWKTRTLTKEVPVYVSAQADSRCIVPRGFVRLYDNAASGVSDVPAPASGSDDADSGLALSAVAATDVANLGAGNEAIAEVRAWREWYAKMAAR